MVNNLLSTAPPADWLTYDFKANVLIVQALAAEIDVTDPDLRNFVSAGGKLLVWQGASDTAVSPQGTIDYVGRCQDGRRCRCLRRLHAFLHGAERSALWRWCGRRSDDGNAARARRLGYRECRPP